MGEGAIRVVSASAHVHAEPRPMKKVSLSPAFDALGLLVALVNRHSAAANVRFSELLDRLGELRSLDKMAAQWTLGNQ